MKSKVIDYKPLKLTKKLSLFSLEYQNKKEETLVWNLVSRRKVPKVISKDFTPDAVVVITWHEETKKLLLLKQYRPSVDGVLIEFPAGKIDKGESIEDAADRELYEETGLSITKIIEISPSLYSSSGMTDESVVFVICECSGEISTEGNEDTEEIEPFWIDKSEVKDLLNEGFDGSINFCVRAWMFLAFQVE